jgi:hypothetical protein
MRGVVVPFPTLVVGLFPECDESGAAQEAFVPSW